MKRKINPGVVIAYVLITWGLWHVIGPWALAITALSMVMYLGMYDYERQKRNARRMRRELRAETRINLANEYARRHPDKA
jgi:Flp pilus assembly protein TadB